MKKPKTMRPELMWAIIDDDGQMVTFSMWRRASLVDLRDRLYPGFRIVRVRVRVTQYKPKPRKRNAP